jgi:CMP-N,N'-diacetyllegionaminic acid synthase
VDLGGRPLISYCIEAVKRSRSVQRIIVDTDDPEIAKIARHYGAETPYLRPAHLAEDQSSTIEVVEHAIDWLQNNESYCPDYTLVIQPTEPFVKAEQIDGLFEKVKADKADSGIAMVSVPRIFHPYHVRHLTEDGYLEFDQTLMHYQHPNRQSDPERFSFGGFWWFNTKCFIKEKQLEVGKRVGLLVDGLSAFDINDPAELEMARLLLPLKK